MATKPLVTVVVLNFLRQDNVDPIIDALSTQTVKCSIVLWHNGITPKKKWPCDYQFASSENLFCWPRWFVAAQARTEYVICMDDDLCPIRPDVVEQVIEMVPPPNMPPRLVGIIGVKLRPRAKYFPTYGRPWLRPEGPPDDGRTSLHLGYVNQPTSVDIVKGRFIAARPQYLSPLRMNMPYQKYCDDIVVSAVVGHKRSEAHLLAPCGGDAFMDLPGIRDSTALSTKSFAHMVRERARRYYFDHV